MHNQQNTSIRTTCLLIALVGVTLTGCSTSYNGERLFWKAQQMSQPLIKGLETATPEQFTKAMNAFQRVIDKAPGTQWAAKSQLAIGSLYALQKNYEKAREAYGLVFQNYNTYKDLTLNARVATAKTYEVEQNWDALVATYDEIADYHPWTQAGLEAPLFVGVLAEKQGNIEQANERYERAVNVYRKLVAEAPTPALQAQAKGYQAQAFQRLGRWNEAVEILTELIESPDGSNKPLALLMLGSIYQTRLQQPEQAAVFYSRLIEEHTKHPYAALAKVQLEHMHQPLPEAASEVQVRVGPLDMPQTLPAPR